MKNGLMSMTDVADYIYQQGADRPSKGTVSNWCNKGVRGVRLKFKKMPFRMYTTKKDLLEFLKQSSKQ